MIDLNKIKVTEENMRIRERNAKKIRLVKNPQKSSRIWGNDMSVFNVTMIIILVVTMIFYLWTLG